MDNVIISSGDQAPLEGHTKVVECVCMLGEPEARQIVSGSGDQTLRVWDSASGACLRVLEGHTRDVTSICMLGQPGAQRIVSGSWDGTLRVWDVKSFECNQVVNTTWYAMSMCVLPQANKLAIACSDNLVRV